MLEILNDKVQRVFDMFDDSFINQYEELILHKKWNIYFLLESIESELHFDYKMLSWLSYRIASHHFKKTSKESMWAMQKLNRWFRYEFDYDDMQKIYSKLGNGCNQALGFRFITSGFDMSLLTTEGSSVRTD